MGTTYSVEIISTDNHTIAISSYSLIEMISYIMMTIEEMSQPSLYVQSNNVSTTYPISFTILYLHPVIMIMVIIPQHHQQQHRNNNNYKLYINYYMIITLTLPIKHNNHNSTYYTSLYTSQE